MDIVERLHESPCSGDIGCAHNLCVEAADEIERLREKNKELEFENDFLEEQNIRRNKIGMDLYEENKWLREALRKIANDDYTLDVWKIAQAALKEGE
jgi:hypothetical protein